MPLFHRPSRQKSKRHKSAEYAALLTFLREAGDDDGNESASVIGDNDKCCIVQVRYGNARPGRRRFYSVSDDTCTVTAISMKEAVDQWGVQYER